MGWDGLDELDGVARVDGIQMESAVGGRGGKSVGLHSIYDYGPYLFRSRQMDLVCTVLVMERNRPFGLHFLFPTAGK